jgi:prevent-host-death family protein
MIKANIHEIKSRLSEYVELVEAGETIVVCKRNVPVAELRRIEQKEKRTPVLGSAARSGKIAIAFGEPIEEADLRLWEEGDSEDPLRKYAPKRKGRKR